MLPEACQRHKTEHGERRQRRKRWVVFFFQSNRVSVNVFSPPFRHVMCNNQLTALWGRLWPVQGAGHEPPPPRCHQWGGCWVRGAGVGMAHAGATGWGWEALRPTASSASGQEAVDCVEPGVGQVTGLSKSVPTAGIFFWGVTEWQKERGYRRSRSD